MYAFTAHTGGDIGDSHNWRAGVSMLSAKASDQGLSAIHAAGNMVGNAFNGDTRVWVSVAALIGPPSGRRTCRTSAMSM